MKNVIEKDMIIAETMCKTVEFISTKIETQCNKCQKFEHTTNTCNVFISADYSRTNEIDATKIAIKFKHLNI